MKNNSLILFIIIILSASPQLFSKQLGKGYDFNGNGKRSFPCEQPIYQVADLPVKIWQGVKAAQQAAAFELQRKQLDWQNNNQRISAAELQHTLHWLAQGAAIEQNLSATLIHGEDSCTNTHFTGYFTPVIELKSKPDAQFHFPLYRMPEQWPEGKKLSRAQIDIEKGLENMGLELGYSASLLDNYFAHVQGSIRAHFVDTGKQLTLAYGGKNSFSYRSLGRYLVKNNYISAKQISLNSIRKFFDLNPDKLSSLLSINDSYTFFKAVEQGPFASSGAQVTALATAAVDKKYIPHGAVLLAEIPQLNKQASVAAYQWRLLVAQDSGAAIKGPGHIDIYMGVGQPAQQKASALHHYGRLYWLQLK
ncbi:MAG: MltA domain-containing protein [Pseudomonadota bacterium]